MKRVALCATVAAAAVLAAPTVASAQALAYPTSDFTGSVSGGGSTVGTFTWYNRSVGVSGDVHDFDGSTTVTFKFFQASSLLDVQTRTASNTATPFGWTEPGPAGGFTKVEIYLSHDGGSNTFIASVPRKSA